MQTTSSFDGWGKRDCLAIPKRDFNAGRILPLLGLDCLKEVSGNTVSSVDILKLMYFFFS